MQKFNHCHYISSVKKKIVHHQVLIKINRQHHFTDGLVDNNVV